MKSTRTKTIHYKRASFLQNDKGTLQSCLKKAIASKSKVGQRQELLDKDSHTYRFINSHRSQLGMFFGNLFLYSKGANHSLITLDDDADEYNVELIAPPEKGGKTREFIDSILYFGVMDNHVLLLQSSSLRSRDFEAYLNWILRETNVTGENNGVVLADLPSMQTRKRLSHAHTKSISIGLPVESGVSQISKHEQTKKRHYELFGRGADILKSVMGSQWFNNFSLKESLDESNIHVNLEILYKRKTTAGAQKLLDDIAVSMRHAEGEDVVIHLEGGGVITGDEIKLSGPVSVQTTNGTIDQGDLYSRMHDWLKEKIDQKILSD